MEFLKIIDKSYLKFFLFIIIYIILYFFILKKHINIYIKNNWYWLKNNPFILLFSKFIYNKNNTNNDFIKYLNNIIKKIFIYFLKPFIYTFNLIKNIIFNISKSLNKFRNMAFLIRKLFKNIVEKIIKKIKNSYVAVKYLQEKFKYLVKKQVAMFLLFQHFLKSFKFILYSFSNGPIPKILNFLMLYGSLMIMSLAACLLCPVPFIGLVMCPVCALCFDENTEILNDLNKYVKIKNIQIGDYLYDKNIVTAVFKIKVNSIQMFKINNTIVSGSHLIFFNKKWIRVEDCKLAKPIEYNKNKIIYCLNTSNNIIKTQFNLFSDYQETNNNNINYKINNIILTYLNKNTNIQQNINYNYYWGFYGKTLIKIGKKYKYIKNIEIGDIINNSKVIGIVKLSSKNVHMYNYNNIFVSGNQLVFENNNWIRVYHSTKAYKINFKYKYIYHVITENNLVNLSNYLFRDFCEVNNKYINDQIDNLVLKYKNKSL